MNDPLSTEQKLLINDTNPLAMPMNEQQYSAPAVVLHWVTAIAIAAAVAIGFYMNSLPKGPERGWWFALHKSMGLSILLLIVIRLSWRRHSRPPAFPVEWGTTEALLAKWGHRGIYLLMLTVAVAGFMTSAYTPNPIKFWGLQIPRLVAENPSLNESWKMLHNNACYLLMAVIAGHTAAAIRHFVHGSRRMLSWQRAETGSEKKIA